MFKEVMNDLWLARISSLSNEVDLYVVLLEVLLFIPNSLIRQSVVFCSVLSITVCSFIFFFCHCIVCHSSMFGFVFHYPFSIFTLFYHSILTTLVLCEMIWSCSCVFHMRVKC
jgi:hypothetical protein